MVESQLHEIKQDPVPCLQMIPGCVWWERVLVSRLSDLHVCSGEIIGQAP